MANLAQKTLLGGGGLNGSLGASNVVGLGIYNYRLTDSDRTSRFLHFKTNVPTNTDRMVTIEAVGYSYATAQVIHCSWGVYAYANAVSSIALHSLAPGLIPNAVYRAADGFVCISAAARDLYFIGVTLNSYTVNNNWGRGLDVSITAAATTVTAGNFY